MTSGMIRVLAIMAVFACAFVARGDPEALAPVWPARAFEAELGGKGVVLELPGDPTQYRSTQVGLFGEVPDASAVVTRFLEKVGPRAVEVDTASVRAEGSNALVFDASPMNEHAPDGVRTLLFVSLRADPYRVERTWMAAEEATTEAVRGIAVIVPGTFGYPPELYEKWSLDLRGRGWTVLRLLSQPSRFTEHVKVEISPGKAAEAAGRFAAHADDRTAECAYAVQAGAAYLEGLDERLNGKPRAILGFSGGAILLPAVVAREPSKYGTAAVVAGGANAAGISIDSTFMKQFIRSVTFEFSGEDTAADREAFERAYLGQASLDTYHAAARFDDTTRVLVIDGSFDKAVPFASSTLMVERFEAGGVTPVRRTYPTNHVMLFVSLNEMIGQINDWVDGGKLSLPPGQEGP